MLEQPREDVVDVEDCAVRSADGRLEGLQRYGAKIERQAFERRAISRRFGKTGTSACGKGILGGPFAVGDLRWWLGVERDAREVGKGLRRAYLCLERILISLGISHCKTTTLTFTHPFSSKSSK